MADLETPWALRVAATLRAAEHIEAGHTDAAGLAEACGADCDSLTRVLRHLARHGVFEEPEPGRFALNDAALSYEPETSQALGFGFRCGFLGLLHMDIVRERLEREYDLELLATTPNVRYEVRITNGETVDVHSPVEMPDPGLIEEILEPYIRASLPGPLPLWIELTGPVTATGPYGRETQARWISITVDDPEGFRQALTPA